MIIDDGDEVVLLKHRFPLIYPWKLSLHLTLFILDFWEKTCAIFSKESVSIWEMPNNIINTLRRNYLIY